MKKKPFIIVFAFFFLAFFFSSGYDLPWLVVLFSSIIYGLVMTSLAYIIYAVILLIRRAYEN